MGTWRKQKQKETLGEGLFINFGRSGRFDMELDTFGTDSYEPYR